MELWRGRVGSEVYAVQNGRQIIRNYSPSRGNPQALANWRKKNFLAFVNVDSHEITLSIQKRSEEAPTLRLQISRNTRNWVDWGLTSTTPLSVKILTNERIYIRGVNNTKTASSHSTSTEEYDGYANYFSSNGLFACEGSILKLLSEKHNENTILPDFCFTGLFRNSRITIAPILPSKKLGSYAYTELFDGCSELISFSNDIDLDYCSERTFEKIANNCSKLQNLPKIKIREFKNSSAVFIRAFYGCENIKKIELFSIPRIGHYTLSGTFRHCSSLEDASGLVCRNLKVFEYGLSNTFFDCIKLIKPPLLPFEEIQGNGYRSTFENCKMLEITPQLPIVVAETNSMQRMFAGCTNLKQVTCSLRNAATANATTNWLSGVSPIGVFRTPQDADWGDTHSPSLIPEGWEREDI